MDRRGERRFRFVRRVDFVSSIGHVAPDGRPREALGLCGGGPDWVVAELSVFDFDPKARIMRLRVLYPDTTIEDVLDNSEFEPMIAPDVGLVPMPTPEQVALIRRFDPLHTSHREFREEDVRRRFDL